MHVLTAFAQGKVNCQCWCCCWWCESVCSPQRSPAGSFRGRHTGSATRCAGRAAARSAYQSAGASSGDWWVQTQQQSIDSMQGSPQASSGHGSDPLCENVHHQIASSVHEHERLAPANRHAVHLVPLHSATGTGTATRSSPEAHVYGSGGDARTSTARDDTCVVHVSAPDAVAPQHHAAEPRPVPSPERSLSDGSLRAGIDLVQPHCSRSFMPHLDSSDRTLQVRLPAAQVAVLLSDAPQVIDPLPGLGASDGGEVEPIDDASDLGDADVRRLYTGLMHLPLVRRLNPVVCLLQHHGCGDFWAAWSCPFTLTTMDVHDTIRSKVNAACCRCRGQPR